MAGLDLQDGEIRHGRGRKDLGGYSYSVDQHSLDINCAIDDVLIGDDDPRWIDDEAGTVGLHPTRWLAGLIGRPHFPDRDADDSRRHLAQDRGLARIHCAAESGPARIDGGEHEKEADQPLHLFPHWWRGTFRRAPRQKFYGLARADVRQRCTAMLTGIPHTDQAYLGTGSAKTLLWQSLIADRRHLCRRSGNHDRAITFRNSPDRSIEAGLVRPGNTATHLRPVLPLPDPLSEAPKEPSHDLPRRR